MAVSVQNSVFAHANTNSATTTIGVSGSDTCLFVCLKASGGPTISSPNVNGAAMTLILSDVPNDLYAYYYLAPAAGTRTVTIGMSATNEWGLLVASLNGVHQSLPIGTATTATNNEQTTISQSATGVTDGLMLDFAAMIYDAMTPGGSQTRLPSAPPNGDTYFSGFVSIGMSSKVGVGSVTMSWTATASFGDNAIIVVPFLPSGGGGGGSPNLREARKFGPQQMLRTLITQ